MTQPNHTYQNLRGGEDLATRLRIAELELETKKLENENLRMRLELARLHYENASRDPTIGPDPVIERYAFTNWDSAVEKQVTKPVQSPGLDNTAIDEIIPRIPKELNASGCKEPAAGKAADPKVSQEQSMARLWEMAKSAAKTNGEISGAERKPASAQKASPESTRTTDTFHEKPTIKKFREKTNRKDTSDWTPMAESSSEKTKRTDTTDRGSEPKKMDITDWESTYCYDVLEHSSSQIRLLTLFPAKDKSANIQCSLETVSLPLEEREYEALSYTWGDESNKHQLFIGKNTLKISQNLYVAISHLRHQHEPRSLWVDAVCINQASDEEKNHQVRQMHDIYFKASKVLIWLGRSDKDIEQAMEFLQVSREMRDRREKPLVGLKKMFNSPWWFRMWVVQEVVAARTDPLVLCGDKCATWEAVSTTLTQISWDQLDDKNMDRFLTDPATFLYFSLLRPKTDRGNTQRETTLESLLRATCGREASDPRDHVYALLGLVSDSHHELFEPDYTKSEVLAYQNAMVSVFKSRQDLDWLVYAPGGGALGKPSWCVDFSMKTWKDDAADRGWEPTSTENRKLNATGAGATIGRAELDILYDSGSGTIKLAGAEIGHIVGVNMSTCGALRAKRRATNSLSSEEIKSTMDDAVKKILHDIGVFTIYAHPALKKRLGPVEASKKLAAGYAWRVAAGGISFDELMRQHKNVESNPNGYAFLEKFVQKTHPIRQIMSHEWADLLPEEPADFHMTAYGAYFEIAHRSGDRCFFTTNTGYTGLAGHLVQEGDVLCVLFGCRLPAVLRPQEDGSYKLVTFTYTHDVMEGEFLRDNASIEEKEFLLR